MKRSEAIQLIISTYGDEFYLDQYRAEEILNALINAGMRPPFFGVHSFSGKCCAKAVEDHLKHRQWEPENE